MAQVKMISIALARHMGVEEAEVIRHLAILLTKVNSNLLLNDTLNNVRHR